MKRVLIAAALAAFSSFTASAQQRQPSAGEMRAIITSLTMQRNDTMGLYASAEAARQELAEENAKLKARVQELEAGVPKAPAPEK